MTFNTIMKNRNTVKKQNRVIRTQTMIFIKILQKMLKLYLILQTMN